MPLVAIHRSGSLAKRLADIQASTRPGSRVQAAARAEIHRLVVEGHARTLLAGKDRYGKTLAPLAESTLRYRKGTGPPTIPHDAASTMIAGFIARWVVQQGVSILLMTIEGPEWVQYHRSGTARMPRRDSLGLSPATWQELGAFFARVPGMILRGH